MADAPVGVGEGDKRNPAPGAPRGNQNALKHGLRARDAGRVDLRRSVDRRVFETVAAIEEALGSRLSPQRALVLAGIGRKLRDLAKIEAYEAELGTIVHRRRRDLLPITEKKWKLLDSIGRDLERLGLDREAVESGVLDAYLEHAGSPQDGRGRDGEPGASDGP